ncbi:MAG: EF-hand domain-containing protein [Polyangiaceae bacterium]
MPPQLEASLYPVLERAFARLAGDDAVIDVHELKAALGLRADYLARRVMAAFDSNGDGVIRRDEFLEGVRKLVLGPPRERLLFAFRVHDHDGDGTLDRTDLERMILLAMAEDDVVSHETKAARLITALMSAVDTNGDGRISFDEFEAAVGRHPHLFEQLTRDEARWIAPNEDLLARIEAARGGERPASEQRERGWAPLAIVAVFALANLALLVVGMMPKGHGGRPPSLLSQVSRATTGPIELDAALILFPVLRRLMTWVRRTWLGRALVVDDAVEFHRIVGHTLFAMSAVHGIATLAGYAEATKPLLAQLATQRAWTGLTLLTVFTVMWVCAWQVVRRSSRFELFYFTHLLYVVWFFLAVAHAPALLGWAGAALVGLAVEQGLRLKRRGRSVEISELRALRSGVTRVLMKRPADFVFRPGAYLFLQVPAIARHEWHPFTITSAPEVSGLTVHVRALGNWTSALRRLAEGTPATDSLIAHVDGPYGSPSEHVFESRFAVLVGAGIGVTPFASILESVVLRANRTGERPAALDRLERAHFFWLNRDGYSFEWFAALLAELERIDGAGVLDVNIWMTGGRAGVTATAFELAREAARAAGDADLITGLKTHTHMGHPDWDSMLGAIARQHAGAKVDVYFCGPPGLGRLVRRAAHKANMTYREEKF